MHVFLQRERETEYVCVTYIYIHTHTHTCVCVCVCLRVCLSLSLSLSLSLCVCAVRKRAILARQQVQTFECDRMVCLWAHRPRCPPPPPSPKSSLVLQGLTVRKKLLTFHLRQIWVRHMKHTQTHKHKDKGASADVVREKECVCPSMLLVCSEIINLDLFSSAHL